MKVQNHHLVSGTALSPQNTLAGIVKKAEKVPRHAIATLLLNSFVSFLPHSSWKFKLKIIHSRHHMWDLSDVENVKRSTLQSLFPNAAHYNFSSS